MTMQRQSANNLCHDEECPHNFPYRREHYHVVTNDGSYVKFIVEKSKIRQSDDYK